MASIVSTPSGSSTVEHVQGKYTVPLIILTTLFFMWGFITCMNDILIPYLQGIFQLSPAQAGTIQSAFFGAYFVISLLYFLFSVNFGDPLAKIGYKNGIIVGLIIAAIGCTLFYPAAEAKSFPLFLIALFVLASGITILQMAANPYVALLGHPSTSSSRLNLTQAFNSLGTTIAPVIGAKLIFEAVGGKENMTADAVKAPYLALAGTLVVIAVLIGVSKLPKVTGEVIEKGLGVLKYSHLTLGVIGIFMYVGGEVAIGTFLVRYFQELMGYTETLAAGYLAYFWGGAMVGRFIGAISLTDQSQRNKTVGMAIISAVAVATVFLIVYQKTNNVTESLNYALIILGLIVFNIIAFVIGKSAPARTLAVFAIFVVGLLVVSVMSGGDVAMWSVIAIGLFNSIMFPTIFTLAIKDLGKYTSQGSSLLVMAIVGGAVMPPLMGLLVTAFGNQYQNAFLFPIVCYLYIFYYGVSGYKVKKKATL
jgi:FHS family L-fucose permease-like MFS transporter